jgi:pyrroline-5-carboxylate reductase
MSRLVVISKRTLATFGNAFEPTKTLGLIGGGNMPSAIVGGLLKFGIHPSKITVSDPFQDARDRHMQSLLNVTADNRQASECEVVFLAVKPPMMEKVCMEITPTAGSSLIVSIASGIVHGDSEMAELQWEDAKYCEFLPTTPSLAGQGATGMYAPLSVSALQRNLVSGMMNSVSPQSYCVESEALLDVVTGVSGSGPAYFFLMVECLERAGIEMGLPVNIARSKLARHVLELDRCSVEP